jgi:hypothetical protein
MGRRRLSPGIEHRAFEDGLVGLWRLRRVPEAGAHPLSSFAENEGGDSYSDEDGAYHSAYNDSSYGSRTQF